MPTSDPGKPANEALTKTLSELESLLTEQQPTATGSPVLNEIAGGGHSIPGEIPVLDELVYADDVDIDEWGQHLELPHATSDQMLQLIDTIEHRLTDELENLVSTLKSTMKQSILEELKAKLETSAQAPITLEHLTGNKPD